MTAPAPLSLEVYLRTHPYGRLDLTGFPDPTFAAEFNQGENILVDITITDSDHNPVPANQIPYVLLSFRRGETVAVAWEWITDGAQSAQIDIDDGHIFLEILKSDTILLAGLYDFNACVSVLDTDYFDSGAETSVMEFNSPVFIRAIPA